MTVRPPHRDELERLRAIELAAGRAFAEVGMPDIAADEPPGVEELEQFLAAGLAWVAADDDGEPVAYLLAAVVDDGLHVEQVSVHPDHSGRRIGAALIEHVAAVARAEGRSALTLTTFRDVPWNAPYYARLGFEVVEPASELAALVARERDEIPGDAPRVAMRRLV